MTSLVAEKGAAGFEGINLLLCENPLPPLPAALEAAEEELPRSNNSTEPFSAPLRRALAERLGVSEHHVHVNAGSLDEVRDPYESPLSAWNYRCASGAAARCC